MYIGAVEKDVRRADIQGLRALAVVAVVLYHARLPGFSGGFVGVDVFFVISGFLIVGLLLRELDASGGIDLVRFWSRRARRLLPNSALTLLAVLAASIVFLPAYRIQDISGDVLAAVLFIVNFRFAERAVDYFRLDDPPSPILHFWSLSVEEQFYILLPLLFVALGLLFAKARHRAVTSLLATLFVASFALSIFIGRENPPMAFFHTETRMWQLALGGLLAAFAITIELNVAAWIRACLAWLGAAAILASIILYSDALAYPGYYALLPAAGAACLLLGAASPAASLLNGILSHPLAGWMGDRSYSLYLWHWPILVFARALFPAAAVEVFALPLSVLVAHLAYTYVEQPFHKGRWSRFNPRRTLVSAMAVILAIATVAGGLRLSPIGAAFPEREQAVAAAIADFGRNYADGCHLNFDQVVQPPCRYGPADAKHTVALVGDSHAAQWLEPLLSAAEASGWDVVSWTKSGCPLADVRIWFVPRKVVYADCDAWRRRIVEKLKGPDRPDLVVVANANNYAGWILGPDLHVLAGPDAHVEWQKGLAASVDDLRAAGVRVALLRDTPKAYKNYRSCLASGTSDCGRPRVEALAGADVDDPFLQERPDIRLIDLTDLICDGEMCPAERGGLIVYRDSEHLTASFARTLAGSFEELLASASNRERAATQ